MKTKIYLLLIISQLFTACSYLSLSRSPSSSEDNCEALTNEFIKELNVKSLLPKSIKRKLIQTPSMNAYQRAKRILINRVKNYDRLDLATYYIENDEEFILFSKRVAGLLEKEMKATITPEESKELAALQKYIDEFAGFSEKIDHLIEERVSYQFAVNQLKKVKLLTDEAVDVEIELKIQGEIKTEIMTFRKVEQNLDLTIKRYEDLIAELDGGFMKTGTIEETLIRQAYLRDLMTFLHHQLEYQIKNNKGNVVDHLLPMFEKINDLIEDSTLNASAYGVKKLNRRLVKAEITDFFKNSADKIITFNQKTEKLMAGELPADPHITPDSTVKRPTTVMSKVLAIPIIKNLVVKGALPYLASGAVAVYYYFKIDNKSGKAVALPVDSKDAKSAEEHRSSTICSLIEKVLE